MCIYYIPNLLYKPICPLLTQSFSHLLTLSLRCVIFFTGLNLINIALHVLFETPNMFSDLVLILLYISLYLICYFLLIYNCYCNLLQTFFLFDLILFCLFVTCLSQRQYIFLLSDCQFVFFLLYFYQ